MSARRRRRAILSALWHDDPMDPDEILRAKVQTLRSRKWKKLLAKHFGIAAFFDRVGKRERALWRTGTYTEPKQRRIVRERRQRHCAHRWWGGGTTWTEYGTEYVAPSCRDCGVDWYPSSAEVIAAARPIAPGSQTQ